MKMLFALLGGLAASAAQAAPVPWTYVSPEGARAMTVATDGSDMLLGTVQGMHISRDGGATWSRVAGVPASVRVLKIVVNPHVPGHWFIKVEKKLPGYSSSDIFQSMPAGDRLETRDGGATWRQIPIFHASLQDGPVIHPAVDKMVAWYEFYSWYHSADGGSTWQGHSDSSRESTKAVVGLSMPGAPFGLISENELVPSRPRYSARLMTNDGSGWSAPIAAIPGPDEMFSRAQLSRSGNSPSLAFWRFDETPAMMGTVDFATGAVVSFPSMEGEAVALLDDPSQAGATIVMRENPGECNQCTRYDLMSLAPGMTQWAARGSIEVGAKFTGWTARPGLVPGASGRLWLADESVGLRRSDDAGQTWQASTGGLREAVVNAVLIDPRNPAILLAGRDFQSLQRSIDGGATWNDVGGDVPQDVRTLARSPVAPDHIVATSKDGFYRSLDAGANWQRVNNVPQPATPAHWGWGNVVWCANDNGSLLANVGQKLYRSTDGGSSWTFARSFPNSLVYLETARLAPRRVYVSGNPMLRTEDCGATFTPMEGVSRVAVDPNDDRHLVSREGFGLGDDYYRVSRDAGATWVVTRNADPGASPWAGSPGWFDACIPDRFINSRGATMYATAEGLHLEEPSMGTPMPNLRAADSRCNGNVSYNVMANDAGGLWVRVFDADSIFRNGFDP